MNTSEHSDWDYVLNMFSVRPNIDTTYFTNLEENRIKNSEADFINEMTSVMAVYHDFNRDFQ